MLGLATLLGSDRLNLHGVVLLAKLRYERLLAGLDQSLVHALVFCLDCIVPHATLSAVRSVQLERQLMVAGLVS